MNTAVELKFKIAISEAIENFFNDEDAIREFDLVHYSDNYSMLAAEAALNVLLAQKDLQKSLEEQDMLKLE